MIEIRTHDGNIGKLDYKTDGTHAISYANWENDVIFHIVPFMPTKENDT